VLRLCKVVGFALILGPCGGNSLLADGIDN